MLIGFTGSQSGMTQFQKDESRKILIEKECSELVFGDCIGSDLQVATIALTVGVRIFTIHPPDNPNKRAWAWDQDKTTKNNRIITPYINKIGISVRWYPVCNYLKRNHHIVDQVALLIATPKEFQHTLRSGTWSTIRYAWKTKKNIIIIPPVDRPIEANSSETELTEESKGE